MIAAQDIAAPLPRAHRQALARAVRTLENPNFAARLADYAGAPVNRVVQMLPCSASAGLSKAVETAMQKCLKTAIGSLEPASKAPPMTWFSTAVAGVTGGVSGFFGMAAVAVELPLTTTIMLRAIADIARHNGENLNTLEARLACLQVFALGARRTAVRTDLGYFAARALMTRLTGNAAAYMVERGAAELSGAMVGGLVAEIVSRFSIVVSDRMAASALPVVGALGGATVNVIFMNHFQQVAQSHFTVRRLEREYGADAIRVHYAELAARSLQDRK
jgi:hypothetical protein